MEFCKKCGAIITVQDGKAACAACGFKPKKRPSIKTTEKLKGKETIAVIKEDSDNVHPVVEMKCAKCKHKKCYFWTMQTRTGDESETKFYKCINCKHTWRVYR